MNPRDFRLGDERTRPGDDLNFVGTDVLFSILSEDFKFHFWRETSRETSRR